MKKAWTLLQCVGLLVFIALATLVVHDGYRRYFAAAYPLKFEAEVTAASDEFDIPPSLIYAMIHTESSFDPRAVSHAGAKGLMQLMDSTLDWALTRAGDTGKYTADDLFDPAVNIHYGVYVLTLLGEQFEHTDTVIAAYNAGLGNVGSWLKDPQYSADGVTLHAYKFPETETYVARVRDAQKRYQELYSIE